MSQKQLTHIAIGIAIGYFVVPPVVAKIKARR